MSAIDESNPFVAESLKQYTPRAGGYDAAGGGWHGDLANDFVNWLPPPPDAAVLDLACGTGLVTLAWSRAIQSTGIIVGVDLTEAMLDQARLKPFPKDGPEVKLVLANIMNLSSVPEVQHVLERRGGFDIISVCSALVLLENAAEAIQHWAQLLKPGTGRIIIDIPAEDHTLMYLFNYPLRRAIGKPFIYDGKWAEDAHTLEKLYEAAGLQVDRTIKTRSYLPERTFRADEIWDAFEHPRGEQVRALAVETGMLEVAKRVWEEIWQDNLRDGQFVDGHKLYVSIGRKPI